MRQIHQLQKYQDNGCDFACKIAAQDVLKRKKLQFLIYQTFNLLATPFFAGRSCATSLLTYLRVLESRIGAQLYFVNLVWPGILYVIQRESVIPAKTHLTRVISPHLVTCCRPTDCQTRVLRRFCAAYSTLLRLSPLLQCT